MARKYNHIIINSMLVFASIAGYINASDNFNIYSNTRLNTQHIVSSISVPSTTMCAVYCIATETCDAFNVEKEDGLDRASQQCQLLRAEPGEYNQLDTNDNEWMFGIVDLCDLRSCAGGEVCQN